MDWGLALAKGVPTFLSIVLLILSYIIEKKRQSPENVRSKWIIEFYKKRRLGRHEKIAKNDTDGLSDDLDDVMGELDVLLRNKKD